MRNLYRLLRGFSACLMVGACLTAGVVCAQSLEVIELKYRTADEVIPILQPLLEQGGVLTGQDDKLIVRASSANLAQLRAALAQIDRMPRQFLVSVRRASRQQIEQERVSAGVAVGNRGAAVSVQATDDRQQRDSHGVASVAVLEGNAAFIATGSNVPVVTSVIRGAGRRGRTGASVGYRDVTSGFTVTPRLAGERVLLEIEQQSQELAGGGVRTQSLATQVSGKPGEWLQLGGVNQSSQSQSSGVLSRQYATRSSDEGVWVRVEVQ